MDDTGEQRYVLIKSVKIRPNPCHPCIYPFKKLAFYKKRPTFEPEQADKFIQSFS